METIILCEEDFKDKATWDALTDKLNAPNASMIEVRVVDIVEAK